MTKIKIAGQEMNKKELKDFTNNKGFFQQFTANRVNADELPKIELSQNAVKTGVKIPKGDNILTFSGIASQNYKKGEKSRNRYKIDQQGWDFKNFFNNPIVLLQHDTEYGGIGNVIDFGWDKAGNLITNFYIDLNNIRDENTKYQIQNGYIKGVSTCHLTHEYMLEDNDDGKRYSYEDALEKFGWENVIMALWGMSDVLTMVVTKAEMLELSAVTIGSNEEAIVGKNSTVFMKNKANEIAATADKNELEKLIVSACTKDGIVDVNKIVTMANEMSVELSVDKVKEIMEANNAEGGEEETATGEEETPATTENDSEEVTTTEEETAAATESENEEEATVEAATENEAGSTEEEVTTTEEDTASENDAGTAATESENEESATASATEEEAPAANSENEEATPESTPVVLDENTLKNIIEKVTEAVLVETNTMLTNALRVVDEKVLEAKNIALEVSKGNTEMQGILIDAFADIDDNLQRIANNQKNTIVDGVPTPVARPNNKEDRKLGHLGNQLKEQFEKKGIHLPE